MEDYELKSCDGLVILALRVRDPDRRDQVLDRLADMCAVRVNSSIFEIDTADWDDGLWDQELEWFTELLDDTRDSVIVWRFTGDLFARFAIGGS